MGSAISTPTEASSLHGVPDDLAGGERTLIFTATSITKMRMKVHWPSWRFHKYK